MSKIKVYSEHGEDFEPELGTGESAGVDVRTPRDVYMMPGSRTKINTGLIVDVNDIDEQVFTLIVPRSSVGIGKGVELLNTVGIVDPDYCGPDDYIYTFLRRRTPDYEFDEITVDYFDFEKFAHRIRRNPTDRLWEAFCEKGVDEGSASRAIRDRYRLTDVQNKKVSVQDTEVLENEIKIKVETVFYNPIEEVDEKVFEEGERFAQMLFIPFEQFDAEFLEDKEQLVDESRGGFGSTGEQ